jgi:hypothetical protein
MCGLSNDELRALVLRQHIIREETRRKLGAGRVATVLGIAGLDGEVDIGQPCMMPALNVPNLDGGRVGISRKQ